MNSFSFSHILEIHKEIFENVDDAEIERLVSILLSHLHTGSVVGLGAGRMGYSLRAFIMRLCHLGFEAYMIGDTTLPRIGPGDLVLVNSSSGNTSSILLYTEQAKKAGATIILLTASKDSKISKLSDITIHYSVVRDVQLMKTTHEQFSFLFWDYIVHRVVDAGNLNVDQIRYNHSILE